MNSTFEGSCSCDPRVHEAERSTGLIIDIVSDGLQAFCEHLINDKFADIEERLSRIEERSRVTMTLAEQTARFVLKPETPN